MEWINTIHPLELGLYIGLIAVCITIAIIVLQERHHPRPNIQLTDDDLAIKLATYFREGSGGKDLTICCPRGEGYELIQVHRTPITNKEKNHAEHYPNVQLREIPL